MHKFDTDFYGEELSAIAVGYIRGELDFKSLDGLIKAINDDIEFAEKQLELPQFKAYQQDPWFTKVPEASTQST
jgi:riboflavin kinase